MKTIDEILEQCNPREEDGHAYYWHGDAVKAAELYAQQFKDEVKDYNTSYGALAVKYKKLEEEKAKLIEALQRIHNPIKWMQENLQPGESINGGMAVQISNDANYLKSIAFEAIKRFTSPQ